MLSDEELSGLQRRFAQAGIWSHRITIGVTLVLLATFPFVLKAISRHPDLSLLMFAIFFGVLVLVAIIAVLGPECVSTSDELKLLSDADAYVCDLAEVCLERSSAARALRETIVGRGRQLRVFDVTAMREIEKEESLSADKTRRSAICKKLNTLI